MKSNNLKNISLIYIFLPVIIFIIGYVRIIISIPISIVLFLLFIKLINENNKETENNNIIEKKHIFIIFFTVMIICILAGHGKFFYQSSDYIIRNALFRDLVNYKWPVYYPDNNTMLVYYIGQWMVPAVFGKIFFFLPEEARFMKANLALLIWNAIGITLSILWVFKTIKPKKKSEYIICFIIFMFFSGLDLIGMIVFGSYNSCSMRIHLEWWARTYQYSSMITQLFWVFNQCIVPWLVTLIIYEEKKVSNYILLITLSLIYGPIPCIGIAIILFFNGIELLVDSFKKKEFSQFLKDVFSIQNILSLLILLPLFCSFYLSNASIQGDNSGGGFSIIKELFSIYGIYYELIFYFLEVGIYGILIYKENKKNLLYYGIFIALLIIPFFKLGYEYDFSMRASIPLLVIVNLLVIKNIINSLRERKITYRIVTIILVLCIGFITPGVEFYRAFNYVNNNIEINESADYKKTLNQTSIDGVANFVTKNTKETSIFFKYIAK